MARFERENDYHPEQEPLNEMRFAQSLVMLITSLPGKERADFVHSRVNAITIVDVLRGTASEQLREEVTSKLEQLTDLLSSKVTRLKS